MWLSSSDHFFKKSSLLVGSGQQIGLSLTVFGIDDAPPVVSKGIVSRTDVPMPDFQLFIKSIILD
jgi:hypothetical protein